MQCSALRSEKVFCEKLTGFQAGDLPRDFGARRRRPARTAAARPRRAVRVVARAPPVPRQQRRLVAAGAAPLGRDAHVHGGRHEAHERANHGRDARAAARVAFEDGGHQAAAECDGRVRVVASSMSGEDPARVIDAPLRRRKPCTRATAGDEKREAPDDVHSEDRVAERGRVLVRVVGDRFARCQRQDEQQEGDEGARERSGLGVRSEEAQARCHG